MSMRFPNVDWWCDHCGALLNFQDGFDDNQDEWVCTECGTINRISESEILDSDQIAQQIAPSEGDCMYCGASLDGADYTLPWEDGDNPEGYWTCPHCHQQIIDWSTADD